MLTKKPTCTSKMLHAPWCDCALTMNEYTLMVQKLHAPCVCAVEKLHALAKIYMHWCMCAPR